MPHALTRRAFLGTAVGVAVLAGPIAANARADTRTVYRLNPDWGADDPTCVANGGSSTCGGCHACVKHAANKRFASRAAADAGRAHPGCKCGVEAVCAVDRATYNQLFATSTSVDLRTAGISEQLNCVPANPTVDPPDGGGSGGNGSTGGNAAAGGATLGAPASSVFPASGAAAATSPSPFAFTGAPVAKLAVIGAAGVAAGAVLLRLRHRGEPALIEAEGEGDSAE